VSPTEPLPSRLIGAEKRIPTDLAMLSGPTEGTVRLPVRLAWSGQTEFEVGDPADRLTLYTTVLDCGQLADVVAYLDAGHLLADWPRVRRLTSQRLVALWESRLPDLASIG
jgi:hypothetical protein